MRKLRQITDALPGLTGGIFLYGALLQIVASALGSGRLYDAVGLWAGIGCAVYMGIHMAVTLRRFLGEDSGTRGGRGRFPAGVVLRYAVVLGVFALLLVSRLGNPVLAFFGVMGLKVSAYLQPFWHRLSPGDKCAKEQEKER